VRDHNKCPIVSLSRKISLSNTTTSLQASEQNLGIKIQQNTPECRSASCLNQIKIGASEKTTAVLTRYAEKKWNRQYFYLLDASLWTKETRYFTQDKPTKNDANDFDNSHFCNVILDVESCVGSMRPDHCHARRDTKRRSVDHGKGRHNDQKGCSYHD